jgi:hypothetical protein
MSAAATVASDVAEMLARYADGLRDGTFVLDTIVTDAEVVLLPPRADEEWAVSSNTGKITVKFSLHKMATRKKHLTEALARL